MKVLVGCYACSPYKGSEPGVGWNMAVALAQYNEVWVVTREKNRSSIEKYIAQHPISNLHFCYHDSNIGVKTIKRVSDFLYYQLWNISFCAKAKVIVEQNKIDIIHHVTFNQYRSIAFGYFINKPLLVGPIGGAELIDKAFDKELTFVTRCRETWRRKLLDAVLLRWLLKRTKMPKMVLFSAKENLIRLQQYISPFAEARVLPAIGVSTWDFPDNMPTDSATSVFTMLYAGRIVDWKGLHLFMHSVSIVKDQLPSLKVILAGINSAKEVGQVTEWCKKYNIENQVELIPWMPREQLLRKLTEINLFVYPAFRDSGSMAILEACAMGCPALCFDAGGQDAFPDDCVIKVPIVHKDYERTLANFSEKILWASQSKSRLQQYGNRARQYVMDNMTWQRKGVIINEIYRNLTSKIRNTEM